jgi:autotransporter passenger strand-loop-strand repeat protein
VAGGAASGTVVSSGGIQYDGGTASGTMLTGGTQVVVGSAADTTVDSGGIQSIAAGGTASDTTVSSGGILYDAGTASNVTLEGGIAQVISDASIDGATINGGVLELQSGAAVGSSTITFASGGTLEIDGTGTYGFLVAGFAVPDVLDLSAINFASAQKNYVGDTSSGTLTVSDGTNSVSLVLLGNYAAGSFNLGPESGGATGTVVTDPPLANGPFLNVTAPPH